MQNTTQKGSAELVSDYDLIAKIQQTGDNNAYIELKTRYERVFYSMCHKYLRACGQLGIREEDILENLDAILFKSAQTFDFARKLKFSTWIANQARYFCLNSMRKGKKTSTHINNTMNTSETNEEEAHFFEVKSEHEADKSEAKNNSDYIQFILSKLKDSHSVNIMKLRYENPRKLSWNMIGQKMNLNPTICKKLHDKTLGLLKQKVLKNTCFDFV